MDGVPVLDLPYVEDVKAETDMNVVVTGAGGHFCAGADLTELEDVSFTERLAEVLQHLAAVPVTTIAAISGSWTISSSAARHGVA